MTPDEDNPQRLNEEPSLTVAVRPDGGIEFSSDNSRKWTEYRVKELGRLLSWFPLKASNAEQVTSLAHMERLTLADVALHLWANSRQPGETPVDQQSRFQFLRYLMKFRMLPGLFRPAAFFKNDTVCGYARADAQHLRTLKLDGYDEAAMIERLKRAGVTEQIADRDVWFDEMRRPAFPVIVEPTGLTPAGVGHLAYLREELKDRTEISLAEFEHLLIERMKGEPNWWRAYTA